MKIMNVAQQDEEEVLRAPPKPVDFERVDTKELRLMVRKMRKTMREANGIGLAANQVNIDMRMFVAEVDKKFYAVFNPSIVKRSEEKISMEEGCLSVPDTFGNIERHEKVTLKGQDIKGRPIKIKAWGLLAIVFQHEVDHLDGKLFIDRATGLHKVEIAK